MLPSNYHVTMLTLSLKLRTSKLQFFKDFFEQKIFLIISITLILLR
jgi:hypothetical protein